MREILFFIASSFWAGAAHAATPGHGKTIAAAYIVGARGKPIDAVILGIFVTLSHTSGIVLVGVLASLGSSWLRPQRIEAYLAVAVEILVIVLGVWMLWTQRDLLARAMGEPGAAGRRAGNGGQAIQVRVVLAEVLDARLLSLTGAVERFVEVTNAGAEVLDLVGEHDLADTSVIALAPSV